MSGFGFFRRRKNGTGKRGSPTWQDSRPRWKNGPRKGRYLHIPQIDRWRAVPFAMPPVPERDTVMERVEQLTQSLDGAIDEGTGGSLDLLIESWAGSWVATVESEYADHSAVITVHRGQAQQWLTQATTTAKHEREELLQCRTDYLASRQRLTGGLADPAPAGAPLTEAGAQSPQRGAAQEGPAAAAAVPDPGPGSARDAMPATGRAPDWTAAHLVADRSRLGLLLVGMLVVLGALSDAVVFKNILELILRQESVAVAWLLAAGATSMALVAAGSLGVALAVHRRGRHLAPRHRPSRLPLAGSAVVWLGLGLAMFLVRWRDNTAVGVPAFGGTPTPAQPTVWIATFFLAIYLVSGVCTALEAERIYNPEFFAFRRLRKRHREQAVRVAKADAEAARAHAALDLHEGELDREDQRRAAAIADRKALAAEAANYARVRMASMMRDPAKTGITVTGPFPKVPSSLGPGPVPGADGNQLHVGVPGAA